MHNEYTHSCTQIQAHIAVPTLTYTLVKCFIVVAAAADIVGGADDGGDCSSDIAFAAAVAVAAIGVSPSLFLYPSEHQLLHFFFQII